MSPALLQDGTQTDVLDVAMLSAMPMGVCLFGRDERKLLATPAFFSLLSLPQEALRDGVSVQEAMLVLAYHGAFGPGDPERQAEALTRQDRTQSHRLRNALPDGRSIEWQFAALSDGRLLITLADHSRLLTRRSQAEQQARHLRELLEALPIGIAVLDGARCLRLSNRLFADCLGCPPEALFVGMTAEQLLAVLKDASNDIAWHESFLPWQAWDMVLQPAPDKPHRLTLETGAWVDLGGRPMQAGGWLIIAQPVEPASPEQDAASRRLRIFEQILQSLPHGVCIYGPDRRLRMVNRAFLALDWRQDMAIGDSFDKSPLASAPTPSGEPSQLDFSRPLYVRRLTPGGTALDVRLLPLVDAGFVCIVTDVSASTIDERVPHPPPDPWQALLPSLPHGVLLWDAEGKLVAWNPKAKAFLELPPDVLRVGLLHQDMLNLLANSGVFGGTEETRARLQELVARDRTQPHVHRRSNLAGRILEVHSDPIAGGGFVVSYSDVTAYHRAEETLKRDREAAEAANAAKSQFLTTMSHELRTPLNAIIGYSEALSREATETLNTERGDDFTKRAAEFAATIHRAGQDLLGLINTFLDVTRIESGRFELAEDRIEIANLVAACVRQATPDARAGEVTIWIDLPKSLPVLHGDERRLRQALSHVLSNAVKFTPAGGSVRVEASQIETGELQVRVTDSGIGIAETDLKRVFEPFVQLDSGFARRTGGSGLGLYVTRALLAAHGGELTLTSRPGQGTTVIMQLPAARLRA